MVWLTYEHNARTQSAVTHQFPITFTEVYNIQAVSYTTLDTLNSGYCTVKSYTNSTVTFVFNCGTMILIIGKITS